MKIVKQDMQLPAVSEEGNLSALIRTIRGVQVMLDRDLSKLYGVETGALNRQVKRNEERFPEDFMFRLSADEWNDLKCQNGISSWGGDRQKVLCVHETGCGRDSRNQEEGVCRGEERQREMIFNAENAERTCNVAIVQTLTVSNSNFQ